MEYCVIFAVQVSFFFSSSIFEPPIQYSARSFVTQQSRIFLYLSIKTVFPHKRKQFDKHKAHIYRRAYSISFVICIIVSSLANLAVLIRYTPERAHTHTFAFEITTLFMLKRKSETGKKMWIAIVSCFTRRIEPLNFYFFLFLVITIISASM